MRKLKLQMQLSVDGFVCGEQGEMDWLTWDWDDALKNYVTELTAPCDLLVMGHTLAKGFIPHWQGLADQTEAADFEIKMAEIQKVVFTNSPGDLRKELHTLNWKHTQIGGENLVEEIMALKKEAGGDIICYGGADFVGSLTAANLIDEYHLFINPAVIGKGLRIFHKLGKSLPLQTSAVTKFDCGIVVLTYRKS